MIKNKTNFGCIDPAESIIKRNKIFWQDCIEDQIRLFKEPSYHNYEQNNSLL